MAYTVDASEVAARFPDYQFVSALTPSAQKAAFHVRDQDGRDLCLKLISPEYEIDRVSREIAALQQLTHQNVVALVEYTFSSKPDEKLHYIVEEFIEGADLAEHLEPGVPWELERVAHFFAQLCDGLDALREARVVHRDLKPHNIRVQLDDTPVLIDFGLARHLSLPDITNTEDGAAIGTPAYFAPEQFTGTKRDIDHRTDLFALGVLVYQALLGRHPFYTGEEEYGELREKICEGQVHFAAEDFLALPRTWQVILKRLMAKSRAKRFAKANQVASFLRNVGGP